MIAQSKSFLHFNSEIKKKIIIEAHICFTSKKSCLIVEFIKKVYLTVIIFCCQNFSTKNLNLWVKNDNCSLLVFEGIILEWFLAIFVLLNARSSYKEKPILYVHIFLANTENNICVSLLSFLWSVNAKQHNDKNSRKFYIIG